MIALLILNSTAHCSLVQILNYRTCRILAQTRRSVHGAFAPYSTDNWKVFRQHRRRQDSDAVCFQRDDIRQRRLILPEPPIRSNIRPYLASRPVHTYVAPQSPALDCLKEEDITLTYNNNQSLLDDYFSSDDSSSMSSTVSELNSQLSNSLTSIDNAFEFII